VKYVILIGIGLFLLTSLVVGTRLVFLYLRTRKLPELLMAVALLCTGFLAFAVGSAGKILMDGSPALRSGLTVLGLSVEYIGDAALALFAWRVFHADKRWSLVFVAALAILSVGAFVGELWSGEYLRYSDSEPITGLWVPFALLVRGLAPTWLAFECLRFHAQLRRRVRIGLADPIVMQRVGLWGVAMTASAGAYVVPIAHRLAYGTGIREHVWAISMVSALAMVTALSMGFAFFPPRKYRERMRSLAPRD
jgi:hypothetical protein